ncbi:LPXTG cell wall anchor domain-containing protein [Micromonospora sp. NPDC047644]|uniref:LPXTG cell wall anchor domain-containing protein n=1 Tax=Micromonospora sp. NPDC047644 TaxID=3157203 RepID=UPI003456F770
MPKQFARRWLAGVGIVGALLAASAVPAFASPAVEDLDFFVKDVVVAPGGPAKGSSLAARTRVSTMEWGEYTVKVDRSKVVDFADVRNGGDANSCTESGPILTCTVVEEENDYYTYITMVDLVVRAKKSATPDQQGDITFTITDSDGGSATYRSTVSIGEGVDLAGVEQRLDLNAALGDTLDLPLTVANRGEKAVESVVLYFEGGYGFGPSKRYRNCEYSPGDAFRHAFACRFPTTIEPGGAARLDSSFGFTVPTDGSAPNGHTGVVHWYTPADFEERQSFNQTRLGQQGTEGELRLEPVGPRSTSRQTDVNYQNGSTVMRLHVSGDQGAEVAALGTPATATGKVGDTVPLKVGYVNNGPAAVNVDGAKDLRARTVLSLPDGVTAVRVPMACLSAGFWVPGKPGAKEYHCREHRRLTQGEKMEYEFGLRLDEAGTRAAEVRLTFDAGVDPNPANDSAKITIIASADGGSESPGGDDGGSESPGGDDGQGGGDTDGSLPITGAKAGLIAGIGGVLLAAGAAGFVVARRRRTRFVA